jgi:hypothetical protein
VIISWVAARFDSRGVLTNVTLPVSIALDSAVVAMVDSAVVAIVPASATP